jgi:hypothetical protein
MSEPGTAYHPPEPSPEQCSTGALIESGEGQGFACWYPQMGGYVARAVIIPAGRDGCFDAWVWHDGEFPFRSPRIPVRLHHCEAAQFRAFADDVEAGLARLAP